MSQDASYQLFSKCSSEPGPHDTCISHLSAAAFSASARFVDPFLVKNRRILERLVESLGASTYERILVSQYDVATDDAARIAVLTLLRRTPDVYSGTLPEAAYVAMAGKTDLEIELLLEARFPYLLPSTRAKDRVYELATSPSVDPGLRTTAMRALGHPADSVYLDKLASTLTTADGPLRRVFLPKVLGTCGRACSSTVVRLLAGSDDDRQVGLRSLAMMPQDEFVTETLAAAGLTSRDKVSPDSVLQ